MPFRREAHESVCYDDYIAKGKLYFRNDSNFPNPILAVRPIHRLRINGIRYTISILELEFSTGGWTPR